MNATKSICLGALTLICVLATAEAQNNPALKITVEKQQKTERDIKRKATVKESGNVEYHTPQISGRNQSVVLDIKIQNTGGQELKGLLVKYAVLGRDVNGKNTELAKQGEQKIDLKPLQSQVIETEPAEFEMTESKFTHGAFTEKNKRAGAKYYGVAIVVLSDTKKVATYFDPPSVDKEVHTLNPDF